MFCSFNAYYTKFVLFILSQQCPSSFKLSPPILNCQTSKTVNLSNTHNELMDTPPMSIKQEPQQLLPNDDDFEDSRLNLVS